MSWTSSELPILANYAQAASGVFILTGIVGLYARHRCAHCHRLARYQVGPHHVPTCSRHRGLEAKR